MMRSLHLTQDMFKLLPMHTMYSMGMAILDDRFPHLTSSPMSLLTPILCKARHQSDCSQVPHLLVYNSPPTADVNMTKLFYLVSTYLMVREWLNYNFLSPRPQYLVYHALALHHCAWLHDPTDQFTSQTVSGNHSPATHTAEQRKIVLDLRRMLGSQDTISSMAYAGTGKTTTLVEMC